MGLPHRESCELSFGFKTALCPGFHAPRFQCPGATGYQFWGWRPCGRLLDEFSVDIRPSIYHDLEHHAMLRSERIGRVPPPTAIQSPGVTVDLEHEREYVREVSSALTSSTRFRNTVSDSVEMWLSAVKVVARMESCFSGEEPVTHGVRVTTSSARDFQMLLLRR